MKPETVEEVKELILQASIGLLVTYREIENGKLPNEAVNRATLLSVAVKLAEIVKILEAD